MTRQEAIKYLIKPIATSTEIGEEKQKEFEAYNMAIETLSKERTGEWIENAPEGQDIDPPYICSICGYAEATRTPFCEQCGCRMIGDDGNDNE